MPWLPDDPYCREVTAYEDELDRRERKRAQEERYREMGDRDIVHCSNCGGWTDSDHAVMTPIGWLCDPCNFAEAA